MRSATQMAKSLPAHQAPAPWQAPTQAKPVEAIQQPHVCTTTANCCTVHRTQESFSASFVGCFRRTDIAFSKTLIQQHNPRSLKRRLKLETGPSTAYVQIDDDNVVHKEDIQDSMLDGDICGCGDLLSSLLLLRRSIQ